MSYKTTDLYDGLTSSFLPRKLILILDTLLYDTPIPYMFREKREEAALLSRTGSRLNQNSEVHNRQWALSFFTVIHNLPPTPAFRDEPAGSPIAEIALRVLVEFEGGETHVVGTATLIAGHLAITGKHVVDYVVRQFGARQNGANIAEVREYAMRLYQVLSGPVYRVWNVYTAWHCETDIAILHLGLFKTSDPNGVIDWKVPRLRCMPPRQ